MDVLAPRPSSRSAEVIARFAAACQADARVEAAFLGGSHARGTADARSDIDFGVIVANAAYDGFLADRDAFVERLGEPIFLEVFDEYGFDILFCVLSDGVECEIALGRAGRFTQIHLGPYRVLVDKTGVLAGVVFTGTGLAPDEQRETLRHRAVWFWHDVAHLVAAVGRGRLWSARGHLDDLRLTCVDLVRLDEDPFGAPDGYEKIELAVPVERLAPLAPTFCPLDRASIVAAAQIIVRFYRELAMALAARHGLAYPDRLDRLVSARLASLGDAPE